MRAAGGEHGIKPERRMKGLLWLILLEPIGLAAFGATSLGPPEVHWIAPLIFVTMIGIANLAIYQATCDYMVCTSSLLHLVHEADSMLRSLPMASIPPAPPAATASAATSSPVSPLCMPRRYTPTSSLVLSGSFRSRPSCSPLSPYRWSSLPISSTSTANGSAVGRSMLRSLPRSVRRRRRTNCAADGIEKDCGVASMPSFALLCKVLFC